MKSSLPKVLHTLSGRSLLGHALVAAQGVTPENLIVVVRHQRDQVAAEALRVVPRAIIADQDHVPGTGRAAYCGIEEARQTGVSLSGTVLVTSGDVPLLTAQTLQELVERHQNADAAVTIVTTVVDDPSGYGRIVRDDTGSVSSIVEQRDASDTQRQIKEINAGIYAFEANFLQSALASLDQNNNQGEVYLTDTVAAAVAQGKKAEAFVLTDPWQAEGCNDRAQLATLRQVLNSRICDRHMKAGVNILDPASTSIDVHAQVAADSTIFPGTQIWGSSVVKEGAEVGPNSTVKDSIIGANAVVPHSVVQDCEVLDGQELEPFTFLTSDSCSNRFSD